MKIIIPAQKQLRKHSDISFSFEEVKKFGKAVDSLCFFITLNKTSQKASLTKDDVPKSVAYQKLIEQ